MNSLCWTKGQPEVGKLLRDGENVNAWGNTFIWGSCYLNRQIDQVHVRNLLLLEQLKSIKKTLVSSGNNKQVRTMVGSQIEPICGGVGDIPADTRLILSVQGTFSLSYL